MVCGMLTIGLGVVIGMMSQLDIQSEQWQTVKCRIQTLECYAPETNTSIQFWVLRRQSIVVKEQYLKDNNIIHIPHTTENYTLYCLNLTF